MLRVRASIVHRKLGMGGWYGRKKMDALGVNMIGCVANILNAIVKMSDTRKWCGGLYLSLILCFKLMSFSCWGVKSLALSLVISFISSLILSLVVIRSTVLLTCYSLTQILRSG